MSDYMQIATVYVDNKINTMDIAQALKNGGYAVAFREDCEEISILEDMNKYDSE